MLTLSLRNTSGAIANILGSTDRDPEAEAEEKVEEEKLPTVEEEGAAAIESGFAATGGDWEAAPAGFAGAGAGAAQPAEWSEAATGQQWDAGTGGAQWAEDAPKEASQW